MAFFQKKPAITDSAPAYSIGAAKNKLIIGLGNPGESYQHNRHNLGFMVVEKFAQLNGFPAWLSKADLRSALTQKTLGDSRVILIKPQTYMNDSGHAAALVQKYYRVYNSDTVAVYDELAIDFGQIRTRLEGSDGGHNGVKSLISHLGEDFGRLRVGVGPSEGDSAKFVLSNFPKSQGANLEKVISEACAILTEYIYGGHLSHDTRTIL